MFLQQNLLFQQLHENYLLEELAIEEEEGLQRRIQIEEEVVFNFDALQ
jgi:hypothetical protein